MNSLAKVIDAITQTMPCEKCPYPCQKQGTASKASCNKHWFDILVNLENRKWNEVNDQLFCQYVKNKQ